MTMQIEIDIVRIGDEPLRDAATRTVKEKVSEGASATIAVWPGAGVETEEGNMLFSNVRLNVEGAPEGFDSIPEDDER
ncbi:hypothetical protein ACQPZP_01245 [Spirillospora sp. CA-142024]|uniref:hypothetical protein n=1 Tax=Spirillospora sp. CA-142024 TaxID=3240036 RepID=UPI003D8EEF09